MADTESTLIVGENGAGKSTMLDALSFALFGKPHRGINKPQLVNSINNKDCLVEVIFQVGSNSFLVRRGMKPNIFEIHQNGVELPQPAKTLDYQKKLEQNILKLNHKSFHQIVVLGSSSFVPFMQLPAQQRRDIIEDLLDINIFSKMNILLKEKTNVLKEKIRNVDNQIDITKTKVDAQKKYIRDLVSLTKSHSEEKKSEISELNTEIGELNKSVTEKKITWLDIKTTEQALRNFLDQKNVLFQNRIETDQKLKILVTKTKFFLDNDNCTECGQEIDEILKSSQKDMSIHEANDLTARKKANTEDARNLSDHIKNATIAIETHRKEANRVSKIQTQISSLQRQISRIQESLIEEKDTGYDADLAKQDLTDLDEAIEKLVDEKLINTDQYGYNVVIAEMLKDTGIKTKVVKQYLPVINKFVNDYLKILDFFVHFELDDSFSETIKSRHRDNFSYESFSEGEKTKIDLALLFTWREIAKRKNSISTNLLILDETFDASLDFDSVNNLAGLLSDSKNTNIFIITHKRELDGRFDKTLRFAKVKGFSKYSQDT